MNSSTLYSPPVFSYSSDAFDNDFDIGLLSEYLLDDDMSHPLPHGNGRKHSFSKSDFSSFPNDEGNLFYFTYFILLILFFNIKL